MATTKVTQRCHSVTKSPAKSYCRLITAQKVTEGHIIVRWGSVWIWCLAGYAGGRSGRLDLLIKRHNALVLSAVHCRKLLGKGVSGLLP